MKPRQTTKFLLSVVLVLTKSQTSSAKLGETNNNNSRQLSTTNKVGWAGQAFSDEEAHDFNSLNSDERLLQLIKTLWPECRNKDAHWCKDLIDDELAQLTFPGAEDINSVILYTRSKNHPTYNAVVIPLDDNDLCVGRNGDGLVHYDFTDWCGSGKVLEAPEDADAIAASSALMNPSPYTLSFPDQPNKVCSDTQVKVNQMPTSNIGGDFDPNACSTTDGYEAYRETINMYTNVPYQGCRPIGPWLCSGMSCKDTCQMIKHLVPDADTNNKNIECWCSYKDGTAKKIQSEDMTASKVRIYAYHKTDKVIGVPELKEGSLGPALPQ